MESATQKESEERAPLAEAPTERAPLNNDSLALLYEFTARLSKLYKTPDSQEAAALRQWLNQDGLKRLQPALILYAEQLKPTL